MPASDTFIAFWKGMTKRVGLKLTDKLLIGNIDTEKPQHIDVQDLPFARQSDLEAEASARASADTGIRNAADIYNVTQKVPLQSGYYTHATARAAVPAAIRKKGLIITYQTDASSWRTEQFFQGELAAWTTDANWKLTGMDFSGDITAINNQISVLKKTAFKRLAADTNLDTVLTPGAYYIGTQEIPDGEQGPALYSKDFLFVAAAGSAILGKVNDATQYRINRDGLSMRKHYTAEVILDGPSKPAYWDEWTALGSEGLAEIENDIAAINNQITALQKTITIPVFEGFVENVNPELAMATTEGIVVFDTRLKKFLLQVGNGISTKFYVEWLGEENNLYGSEDFVGQNLQPYKNKLYQCNSFLYMWDGQNLQLMTPTVSVAEGQEPIKIWVGPPGDLPPEDQRAGTKTLYITVENNE